MTLPSDGLPQPGNPSPPQSDEAASIIGGVADKIRKGLSAVIFGHDRAVEMLLVGLLSEGHILVEGLPGTAKTTMVKSVARLLGLEFNRIQLTPDMLPAEITGTGVYDLNARSFNFRPGPIFTDLLLADEINRTPPKTQSALLEAMEEQQVTVDGVQHGLSSLFTVVATLNPVEFAGTFPLPEAQLDRFMMKVLVNYPEPEAEKRMMQQFSRESGTRFLLQRNITAVSNRDEIMQCRRLLGHILVDESVMDYILEIVQATRNNVNVYLGCSPRGALSMMAASRAHAAIKRQGFVTPDNVKAIAPEVLRHRLLLTPEAELDGLTVDRIIQQILAKVPVPR